MRRSNLKIEWLEVKFNIGDLNKKIEIIFKYIFLEKYT
jgi:hypothetical protein